MKKIKINDLEKWFNGKSPNKKLLLEFFDYCVYHPDERFWQALRNWSEVESIWVNTSKMGDDLLKDTFYFKGKNH